MYFKFGGYKYTQIHPLIYPTTSLFKMFWLSTFRSLKVLVFPLRYKCVISEDIRVRVGKLQNN